MIAENTVAFLERFSPGALAEVRGRHPEAAAVLEGRGVVLGGSDDDALADATLVMLQTITTLADRAVGEVTGRLKRARRIEMVGSVIAILSSGGVVGVTAGFKSWWGGAMLGCLSFVSAAAPQVVNWLRQSDLGAHTAAENLLKLREGAWDANRLLRKWNAASTTDAQALAEADELARAMYLCLGDLGYHATV